MFACLCVIFIQDKVEINVSDKNGKTPLMLAVGRKHDKVIAYLQKELKQRNSFIPRIDSWWVPGHRLVNVTRSELTWFRQIMTALLRSCSSCSYSLNQLRCAIYAQSDLSCDDSVLWITLVTVLIFWNELVTAVHKDIGEDLSETLSSDSDWLNLPTIVICQAWCLFLVHYS